MEVQESNYFEIVVDKSSLLKALNIASSVIERRNVMMELSAVKLSARGNLLEISATDNDFYLQQIIGAQIIQSNDTSVAAKVFTDIIRKVPDTEILLRQDHKDSPLKIVGKNCNFDLLTIDPDKFPNMLAIENSKASFKIAASTISKLIDHSIFAVSHDDTRYNLNGVYLHIGNGYFKAAATDGHRLALAVNSLQQNSETNLLENFGIIVPEKTLQLVNRIIKENKNITNINVGLSTNKVSFEFGNTKMLSKLIDGNFPEYNKFIPEDYDVELTINSKILADAIERVVIVTSDKFRAIKLQISNELCQVTASGEAIGKAIEVLEYSDEQEKYCQLSRTLENSIDIGLNPAYISQILQATTDSIIKICIKSIGAPVLIKIYDLETKSVTDDAFVVMPLKI